MSQDEQASAKADGGHDAGSFAQWFRELWRQVLPIHWLLLLIVIGAFVVRSAWISHGLPYQCFWDEPEIMQPAIKLLRNGVYRPERFAYGPMNAYIHAGWGALTFVRGMEKGEFPDGIWGLKSNRETGWYWSINSPYFYREARLLSVLLGCLAILAIYKAGKLLGGNPAGIWAAAVIAFLFTDYIQTSIVTSDAASMAAAALAIWASVVIMQSRAPWAYATAIIACALSVSLKYINMPVLLFPILGHLFSVSHPRQKLFDLRFFLVFAGFAAGLSLFLLPAFLQPTRFLHDLSTEVSYYGRAMDERWTPVGFVTRLAKHVFVCFDMGEYVTGEGGYWSDFRFKWQGIGFLLTGALGIVLLLKTNMKIAVFLLLPAALHLVFVGLHGKHFFARNFLLTMHALALASGFGWLAVCGWLTARPRLAAPPWKLPVASVLIGVMLIAPMAARVAASAWKAFTFEDSRVTMSRLMLEKLPEKTKIAILDELRWVVTPQEAQKFLLSRNTISGAMISPITTETQYILAPASLTYYTWNPLKKKQADLMNLWLSRGNDEIVVEGLGKPVYFGKPTISPKARLIKNDESFQLPPRIPLNEIYGPAFKPTGRPDSVMLSDGTMSVRPGATIEAPVRLTKNMTSVVLRAKGSSPDRQEVPTVMNIELYEMKDTARKNKIMRGAFELDRSQSGIMDYRLGTNLAAGDYVARLRSTDPENFLVEIELLSFFGPS